LDTRQIFISHVSDAEPIKLWLARVGYERIQEIADPKKSLNRAGENWRKHGGSEK